MNWQALTKPSLRSNNYEPEPRAVAAHLRVDVTIAERLENRADLAVEDDRRELREHFPISEVADDQDEARRR